MRKKFLKQSQSVATLQSKEQAWDKIRQYPVDPNFQWPSSGNFGYIFLRQMAQPHIFNALKKAMNNFINELLNRGFDKEKIRKLLQENFSKL